MGSPSAGQPPDGPRRALISQGRDSRPTTILSRQAASGSAMARRLPAARRPPGGCMRTSSYVIYVDLPDTQDEVLLVHGYTGAYDRVSRKVAAFLRNGEAGHVPRPLYGTWD